MIELVKKVPDTYVRQSRDFQVMLRAYSLTLNWALFYIDSLRNVSDTQRCVNSCLKWLKTRLGFFNKEFISDENLRQILVVFPEILKWKGSIKGIRYAVILYTNLYNLNTDVKIEYDKELGELSILTDVGLGDKTILNEIFRYILPTGIVVNYYFTDIVHSTNSSIVYFDETVTMSDKTQATSELYSSNDSNNVVEQRNLHSLDTFTIYQNKVDE